MAKSVLYKGVHLMSGSRAYELYTNWQQEKDPKAKQRNEVALKSHMNELNEKEKELLKRYA